MRRRQPRGIVRLAVELDSDWTDHVLNAIHPLRGDIIASHLLTLTSNTLARHRTGAGEPLVLLHGVGESVIGWRPVQDKLSKDYDVIAVDLPGFGHSPPHFPQGLRRRRRLLRMRLNGSWIGLA